MIGKKAWSALAGTVLAGTVLAGTVLAASVLVTGGAEAQFKVPDLGKLKRTLERLLPPQTAPQPDTTEDDGRDTSTVPRRTRQPGLLRSQRQAGAALTVASNPVRNAAGHWSCATSGTIGRVGTVRIVSARQVDRPNVSGMQSMFIGPIRRFWQVELEFTPAPHQQRPYALSYRMDAWEEGGTAWQWMDAERNIRRGEEPAGASVRRTALAISYDAGPFPDRMVAKIGATMKIQSEKQYGFPATLGGEFGFPAIPSNCMDDAVAAPAQVANTVVSTPAGPLIRPVQVAAPNIAKVNAKPGTVREAVQIGFIWSYGEGVHPDFDQGRAWYEEAQRRQQKARDFSMQNEIKLTLGYYAITDRLKLLERGLPALARNSWQEAQFFFGRAAQLGDAQGMAALGYTYAEGRVNSRMEYYWCRKAFLAARASRVQHELDAVNHFCATTTFQSLMTPAERRANPASIARAKAKSGAIQRQHEAAIEMGRKLYLASLPPDRRGNDLADAEADLERDRSYSRGESSMPPPVMTSGLYGNCHGGAAYGC